MKQFINDNFLLGNKVAEKLYHRYAENLPIFDFHCHLSPAMISEDRQFRNITHAWLEGDHYKWRAMRTNGISEEFCTGLASEEEKFRKWSETVPITIGNPLYHWTHLELARYFGIFELLSPSTAVTIFDKTSLLLQTKEYSTRSLIRKMKVEIICTTDDPADLLQHHLELKRSFEIAVLPTFRPDNALKTEDPEKFTTYIQKLAQVNGSEIRNFDNLVESLDARHSFFHESGCRLSDHGLDRFFYAESTPSEVNRIFKKLLKGRRISSDETEQYKSALMTELCRMNHARGWTQQFHIGALRNNNFRKYRQMGADTGWDSIGVSQDAFRMSKFLNALDNTDQLSKTILYNLNPSDNEMMITMAANFNDGSSVMKVQYGPAWWFLDQNYGMERHLKDLSVLSLLSRFIGMVTDSRSFLSYPRHEYFRRVACNYIGEEVEKGLIPDEEELLKPLIEGISYTNAKNYFNFSQ